MIIFILIGLIFLFSGFGWIARKMFRMPVCPICVGVCATWITILAGMAMGWLDGVEWTLAAGTLMGGSIVGIADKLEKRLPPHRSPIAWKMLWIPAGFAAVIAGFQKNLVALAIALAFLIVVAIGFLRKSSDAPPNSTVSKLQKKLDDCC